MGNDYNDCVLTYGKLTLAYQTGTYANFGVTMTSQNTSPYNTYVEDKRIKTIVIASEDNIEDEENYKTFKEKVVERTVKLDVEYRRIQQEMIEDYKTETSEYKEFLKKESPKLFQVFEESGSRNLRTFKSSVAILNERDFLYRLLKEPNIRKRSRSEI